MNLPETMQAIEISTPGGPEVLEVTQRAIPSLDENEVLINVRVAGINRPDCLQRMGGYPPPLGASDIPGLEVAGEIVAVGSSVAPINVGKHVMALVPGGGYAEYVNVDISNTFTIPAGLSMEEAGAIPETFFTVWHNVFERGGLLEGETFMVHGGTSGIGTTAIQRKGFWGNRYHDRRHR